MSRVTIINTKRLLLLLLLLAGREHSGGFENSVPETNRLRFGRLSQGRRLHGIRW